MARLWSIPLRQQRSYSTSCTVHSLNRVTTLSAQGSRISAGLSIGECAVVQSPEIKMEHRTAGRDSHDLLRRDLTLKNLLRFSTTWSDGGSYRSTFTDQIRV